MMKATNKICRDKKLSNESKIDELVKLGFSEEQANEIMTPDYMGRIGFASFSLTNNNANIRRLEQQLKRAVQLAGNRNHRDRNKRGAGSYEYRRKSVTTLFSRQNPMKK